LVVDPQRFEAGTTYLLEAVTGDYCPNGQLGRSRPIVLRVRSTAELTLASADPLAAFLHTANDGENSRLERFSEIMPRRDYFCQIKQNLRRWYGSW